MCQSQVDPFAYLLVDASKKLKEKLASTVQDTKKIANVVVGLMEVYPSMCLDGYHGGLPFNLFGMSICFEKLEQNPHIWSH